MKYTILYARVYTQKQYKDGHSLNAQIDLLKKYCELKNYKNILIFEEVISSNKKIRPEWQKIIEMVEKNEVSNIIVYSLSRFSRNVSDANNDISTMRKYNVIFQSLTENIDIHTEEGLKSVIEYIDRAENEKNLISDRTKMILSYKKSIGELIGQIPFGYDCVDGKNLTQNIDEQNTLQLIRQLRDSKYSYSQIANHLIENGFKNKKGESKWYQSQIVRFLKEPSKKQLIFRKLNKYDYKKSDLGKKYLDYFI